jgi:hypothetical protein
MAGAQGVLQPFKSQQGERTLTMVRATIVAELEAERDRPDSAIAPLRGSPSRPKTDRKDNGRRRRLSAAARRKIGEATEEALGRAQKKAAA